jgi:hypothetical protein
VTEISAAASPNERESAQSPDGVELDGNVVPGSLEISLVFQLQSRSRRRRDMESRDEQQQSSG